MSRDGAPRWHLTRRRDAAVRFHRTEWKQRPYHFPSSALSAWLHRNGGSQETVQNGEFPVGTYDPRGVPTERSPVTVARGTTRNFRRYLRYCCPPFCPFRILLSNFRGDRTGRCGKGCGVGSRRGVRISVGRETNGMSSMWVPQELLDWINPTVGRSRGVELWCHMEGSSWVPNRSQVEKVVHKRQKCWWHAQRIFVQISVSAANHKLKLILDCLKCESQTCLP